MSRKQSKKKIHLTVEEADPLVTSLLQNLSEWKQRGYQEWLTQQETLAQVRELAADAGELADVTDGALADHLATVLTARYASALAGWNGEVTDEFRRKLRSLRGLCQDIVELRRGATTVPRV